MKTKRGLGLSPVFSFVVAVVMLMFFWLFLLLARVDIPDGDALPGDGFLDEGHLEGPTIQGTLSGVGSNPACNRDLISFLRSDSGEGVTYAELLARGQKSSEALDKYERKATKLFDSLSDRRVAMSKPKGEGWLLQASSENVPFSTLGRTFEGRDIYTCEQIIPSLEPEKTITVKLRLDK